MRLAKASWCGALIASAMVGCGLGQEQRGPTTDGDDGAAAEDPDPGAGNLPNDAKYASFLEGDTDANGEPLRAFDACPQEWEPSTLHLVAEDSHSLGSAAYASDALSAFAEAPFGLPPVPSAIQPIEIINAYGLGYAAEDSAVLEGALAVDAAGEPIPTEVILQVALVAPPDLARRDVHVVFVVDTSGSMSGDSMARQKELLKTAASSLHAGDMVTVVSWNSESRELLKPTTVGGPDDPLFLETIDALETNGGNNLAAGLAFALERALETGPPGGSKRIVFVTDGAATAGDPAAESILHRIGTEGVAAGIGFIGVGVGPAQSYHPQLLRDVLAQTRGTFFYGGSADAAASFGQRFDGLMDNVMVDVSLQLELPHFLQMPEEVTEELAPDLAQLRSHGLAVNGTMVFRQRILACDPSVWTSPDTADALVEGRIVYEPIGGGEPQAIELTPVSVHALDDLESPRMLRTRALIDYAEALRDPTVERVSHAQQLLGSTADPQLADLAALLGRHPVLLPVR